jgi:hypothetical protein
VVVEAKLISIVRGKFMLVVRRLVIESAQNQSLLRGVQSTRRITHTYPPGVL